MWPFKCKECPKLHKLYEHANELYKKELQNSSTLASANGQLQDTVQGLLKELGAAKALQDIKWMELGGSSDSLDPYPPTNANILVANKDFTYFGFLYMTDGWDLSRRINMQGKENVWPTYTNTESIHWWLNLDLITKG